MIATMIANVRIVRNFPPLYIFTRDIMEKVAFGLAQTCILLGIRDWAHNSDWYKIFLPLDVLFLISFLMGWMTLYSIPSVAALIVKAGLVGVDAHRPLNSNKPIPEAMGVVVGFAYVVGLTLFVPVVFTSNDSVRSLSMFLAALLSVNSMCFLGFVDNVLNLRWRHKFILPTIASLPVLFVYYSQGGSTYVVVPDIVHKVLGHEKFLAIEFGGFYYLFLSMLSVFGTNAINILAGINGLEVGQSIVLSLAMIANVLVQMNRHKWEEWQYNTETVFSLYLLVPFVTTSLALWVFNKYPSRVFVGDTYCYLAGTVLAVSGILGHCSKTLLLFMLPQLVNFLYSLPQILRIIPCPRHRMPEYISESDSVGMSFTDWIDVASMDKRMITMIGSVTKVERRTNKIRFMNMTLINYTLWKLGKPVNEGKLVNVILFWQIVWIIVAFGMRYKAASLLYSLVE